MKKHMRSLKARLLLTGFGLLLGTMMYAQQNAKGVVSPGGTFDKVFDHYGNSYKLEDIRIKVPTDRPPVRDKGATAQALGSQTLCTSSGYFDLYFETGSGCEGTSAVEIARRNVFCQLFTDISNFIVPANPSARVKVWVRDINALVPGAATSGVLGLASSFYTMPAGAPAVGGIVDGELWKTIHEGVDSYTNVATPLVSTGGASLGYYHGMMAFNFYNPAFSWHTNLGAATATTDYDLYTVALHEITHALGFASLINFNGASKFGTGYNYYSRYDLFLQTQSGQNLIKNSTSCTLYNYAFNGALNPNTLLSPNPATCGSAIPYSGSLNNTTCGTAVKFAGSVNQAVYTPDCFEPPSSLSHLEDQCHSPSAYPNDAYYCMSNANGFGPTYMKRYLKPEERAVLCDIGYRVNTSYGNGLYSANFYNYGGSQCPGLWVGGVNDGIVGGSYVWATTTGSPINIPGSQIIGNDFNTTQFECLEDVYGMGTLSITSGNGSSTLVYTPTAAAGTAVLRYVPVSPSGDRGNITYLYIRINSTGCVAGPCNIVNNGDFENTTIGCTYYVTNQVNCWSTYTSSPDLFGRFCSPLSVPTPLSYSNPASDTWNNGAGGNDHMVGFWGSYDGNYIDEESIQSTLSTPITTGGTYTVKFQAKVASGGMFASLPANIAICGSLNTLVASGTNYDMTNPNLVPLTSVTVPNDGQWHNMVATFSYSGANTLTNILIGYDATTTVYTGGARYVYIDGMEMTPTGIMGTFTPPSPVCPGQVITNLESYGTPPGGVVSGPGVTVVGSSYSFSAASAGVYPISYTYTNALGCVVTIPGYITVGAQTATFTPPSPICPGQTIPNLESYGSPSGGTVTGPGVAVSGSVYTFTATTPGTYLLTYSVGTGSCVATGTANVVVIGPVGVSASTQVVCEGTPVILTASGGSGTYTWTPAVSCTAPCNTVSINPSFGTTYTVSSGLPGCISTATITVAINAAMSCCKPATTIIKTGGFSSVIPIASGSIVDIQGLFTINSNVTYTNVEFRMAPGASIVVNPVNSLTLNNCHLFSCTDMWDGLYLQQSGTDAGDLYMTNTSLEDAIHGIYANSNATAVASIIKLSACFLNKNYTSMILQDYTGGPAYTMDMMSTTVSCYSSGYSIGPLLKAPYTGQRSKYGIWLLNVKNSLVGNTSSSSLINSFVNLDYGVHVANSSAKILNNSFTMSGEIFACSPTCVDPTGIAIYAPNTSQTNTQLIVGGTGANEPNKFTDVLQGVNARNIGYANIYSNTFSCANTPTGFSPAAGLTSHYGVYLSEINVLAEIRYNTFTNFAFTIQHDRNLSTSTAYNPNIYFTGNTINTSGSGYVARGIFLLDVVGNTINTPAGIEIRDNKITDVTIFGIAAQAIMNKPQIFGTNTGNQTVQLRYASGVIKPRYAIQVNLCLNAIVKNNYVSSTNNGNLNMTGIGVFDSQKSLVSCNTANLIGQGFQFSGNCTSPYTSGTSYNFGVLNNTINSTLAGFSFANNAILGQQGDPTHATGNIWVNAPGSYTGGQTRTDASSIPSSSVFYCRTSPTTLWPINHVTVGGTTYVNGSTILAASGAPTACSTSTVPNGFVAGPAQPGESNVDRTEAMDVNSVIVYPNPNNGIFTLLAESEMNNVTIRVINLVGQVIMEKNVKAFMRQEIDLSDYGNGLYQIQISNAQQSRFLKVIKQ